MSRAVLIGVSTAILVAPAAFAAPALASQPTTEQQQETIKERIAGYAKRAEQVVADVKAAKTAVDAAKTKPEAQKAKDAAVKAKKAADTLEQELQKFLDDESLTWTHEDRIATGRVLSSVQKAQTDVDAAIKAADEKINKPEAKGEIAVEPNQAGRGQVVAIVVFCPEGKVDNFASDAIDIVASSRYTEGPVSAIGGFVKQDATAGQHTATATCGKDKLTATFTVTAAAPVEAKPPTADEVRRKTVVKPKGKIETGGGATALQTV